MFSFGLMLHHFHGGAHPQGQGTISADDLADIIEYLGPRNVLAPDDWIERSLAGRLEPYHRCITLDDALRCQMDVAKPVFDAYNLKAFFFVYSVVFEGKVERTELFRHYRTVRFQDVEEFYAAFFRILNKSEYASEVRDMVEDFDSIGYLSNYSFYSRSDRMFRYVRDVVLGRDRYFSVIDGMIEADAAYDSTAASRSLWLSPQDVSLLHEEGHVIGLHSHTHPTSLASLSAEEQRSEYVANMEHLSALLGEAPRTMSHPLNSYNLDTLNLLADLGVKIGFRDNMMLGPDASLLEQPREDHANIMSAIRK
ncbi:polysaccharide deacetylase family protein [Devosia sp. BSSL-BM10]|uniref:Chitooligosaccharide deacetylase n=1 Tax=Devosia litorisediminis TaxID=2829817 RepID=A0A942IEU8_9HYPH|nr:polysaccharide deacetylase family protein [Devosia litorisediminis]MBS3849805.1 polysaccharide deacetylase family protein [Devosia litorisediminis]